MERAQVGWFAKSLGDAMFAGEPMDEIRALFAAEHARAGRPPEMAVFVRHESEGRLHCEVKAYFSPAARAVAEALDADPCPRPSPDGLDLLAGTEAAWLALFPERGRGR